MEQQTHIVVDDDTNDLFGYRVNFASPKGGRTQDAPVGEGKPATVEQVETKLGTGDIVKPSFSTAGFRVPLKKRGGRPARKARNICLFHGRLRNDIRLGGVPVFSPCPDGVAAAFALWHSVASVQPYTPRRSKRNPNPQTVHKKMAPQWEFLMWDSGLTNMSEDVPLIPDLGDGCTGVVVMDLSLPPAVLDFWRKCGIKVRLIDHHKSAWATLFGANALTRAVLEPVRTHELWLDTAHSAATLAWEIYNPMLDLPDLFRWIEDRDTGRNELPYSYQAFHGLSQMRYEGMKKAGLMGVFEVFDRLIKLPYDELLTTLISASAEKIVTIEQQIAGVLPDGIMSRFTLPSGETVPVCVFYLNCDGSQDSLPTEIAYRVFADVSESQIGFIACRNSKGTWALRSRSKGAIDVEQIARAFGGGGHRNAASGAKNLTFVAY